ncbi:MAG: SIS domain-containing protein [Anaerolineae bacterium]|nr:SIS domain-containing protein [Anaerolineae bacterium]
MPTQSHLYQEIHEQPQVLSRLLENEQAIIQQLAAAVQEHHITHVVIAARGTSDNAGRYAQYLLGAVNGITVTLTTPSLFSIYKQPPRFGNALVLGISQSGKSPDIVAVLAEAQRQQALTAAITTFTDSDLAQQTDFVIDLNAGVERSIAATKTYTAELAAIALLSAQLAHDDSMLATLAQIPDTVTTTLTIEPEIAHIAQRYRYMRDCVVIGRGYNYATAFELALKLKELTYTIAEPYSSADFMHGPLALIEYGFPAIVIAPSGVILPEMQNFIHTLKQREAEVIAISDDPDTLKLARIPLTLPQSVPEWLSPIITIIPGQLFAMHLAHVRDYDPDHPRGLRKVTETK